MKISRLQKLSVFAISLCSVNCANSSHLLVYQTTNVGLNAGCNPQSGNIHARIGVRREFACIVPKVQSEELESNIEAGSSYVASRVRVRSIWKSPEIAEVIATGEAATQLGSKPESLTPFIKPVKQ